MKVSTSFLRQVQTAGWRIEVVEEEGCLARCPVSGIRVRLRADGEIPASGVNGAEVVELKSYDDARLALRARRRQLRLSILEVEELAGVSTDHIAKAEKDNPSRVASLETLVLWANALGYRIVLEPVPMTPMTLRVIEQTRGLLKRRSQALSAS